jgi:hypothetical protein
MAESRGNKIRENQFSLGITVTMFQTSGPATEVTRIHGSSI